MNSYLYNAFTWDMKYLLIPGLILLLGSAAFTQTAFREIPEYQKFDDLYPLLSVNNDTTYVINFWATWCKPCVKELPYFEQLGKLYAARPVKVILVSLDMRKDLDSKLKKFVEDKNLMSEVLALTDVDHNSWIPKVDESWTGAIPATLIRKGKNTHFLEGEWDDLPDLSKAVEAITQKTF